MPLPPSARCHSRGLPSIPALLAARTSGQMAGTSSPATPCCSTLASAPATPNSSDACGRNPRSSPESPTSSQLPPHKQQPGQRPRRQRSARTPPGTTYHQPRSALDRAATPSRTPVL